MRSKNPYGENPGAPTGIGSVVNRAQTPLILIGGFFRLCVLTG
jgi:hypothetical protein